MSLNFLVIISREFVFSTWQHITINTNAKTPQFMAAMSLLTHSINCYKSCCGSLAARSFQSERLNRTVTIDKRFSEARRRRLLTLHFFFKFVSQANNSKRYIDKMSSLENKKYRPWKVFGVKPASNPAHRRFLEHWNSQKNLCNIWQCFSCLLDEWIAKECKKKFFVVFFFLKST